MRIAFRVASRSTRMASFCGLCVTWRPPRRGGMVQQNGPLRNAPWRLPRREGMASGPRQWGGLREKVQSAPFGVRARLGCSHMGQWAAPRGAARAASLGPRRALGQLRIPSGSSGCNARRRIGLTWGADCYRMRLESGEPQDLAAGIDYTDQAL